MSEVRVYMFNDTDFLSFMSALGSMAPHAMDQKHLITLIGVLLETYCCDDDIEFVAQLAAEKALGRCADAALHAAVGPEDGIN